MFEHRIVLKEKKLQHLNASATRTSDLRTQGRLPDVTRTRYAPIIPDGADDEDVIDSTEYEEVVVFESTPEVQEQAQTLYISLDEIRSAGSLMVYMGSPGRTFQINHKFVSRTTKEATKTWKAMNILRSWRMPKTSNSNGDQIGGFGVAETNVPTILNLFGYGRTFKGIPTVMTNLSIDWNSESDYIKCLNKSDVPIILPVSISLKEVRTIEELKSFNLKEFKEGDLIWW